MHVGKITLMAKYSKKAQDKVEKSMHERKHGTLKSGSGKKVKSKKQAIAIGLSEARKEGAKVPRKASSKKSGRKKPGPKKGSTKKSSAKKSSKKKSSKKSK
jgi:hypothetical protein